MIDIKFLRENPDAVKENIKKKFQDYKLPLVDQVIELDEQSRAVKKQADELRSNRNKISKQIGSLMAQGKKEEGMALKEEVTKQAQQLAELEKQDAELQQQQQTLMAPIYEKARKVVEELAKAGSYIYVFDVNSMLYYDATQSTDLTPAARKALNIPEGRTLETLQAELQAQQANVE